MANMSRQRISDAAAWLPLSQHSSWLGGPGHDLAQGEGRRRLPTGLPLAATPGYHEFDVQTAAQGLFQPAPMHAFRQPGYA